jgi:3-hydroxybutyryl-CoA dehydrogenase
MGRGIAQVCAQAGIATTLIDADATRPKEAVQAVAADLAKLAERGKISGDDVARVRELLRPGRDLSDGAGADLVIEAVFEDLELKKRVFADLEAKVSDRTVLASNTSALPITAIAGSCRHPERVVGLHFFNPVPRMALVEVISAHTTASAVAERALTFVRHLGKSPIAALDTPGFVVNRVARPFYLEALKQLGENDHDAATIDAAIRAAGFRMGPFELLDLIGVDVNFAVTSAVYDGYFGEPRFRPHPIQRQMVLARQLGRKTGRGFYVYEGGQAPQAPAPSYDTADAFALPGLHPIAARVVAMLANEACFALGEGVAGSADIDLAMRLGMNFPQGPLEWADKIGPERIVRLLDSLREFYGEERYKVAPRLRRSAAEGRTF